jgi:hypothetical protein
MHVIQEIKSSGLGLVHLIKKSSNREGAAENKNLNTEIFSSI